MGETEYYTPPKPETNHRCRVYPFGVLWFWKCQNPHCKHGGRKWVQQDAMDAAVEHVKSQPWVSGDGRTITYEQARRECDALDFLADISEESDRG